MTLVKYQQSKMLWNAVGCAVLAVGGLWVAFFSEWIFKLRLLGGLLGLSLPFVSTALALRMRSGLAALKFDRTTLEIATFYRSTAHRWSDVRDISRETLTRSSAFGLIKQDLAHYLVIAVADEDGLQNTYRLQEELLDWPKDRFPALVEQLNAIWMGQSVIATGPMPVQNTAASVPATLNGVPMRANAPAGFGRRGL